MSIIIDNGITIGNGINIGIPAPTNGSVLFNGTNNLSVAGGPGTAMGAGDFTWECFVYPTTTSNWQRFIDSGDNSLLNGYQLTTQPGSFAPIVQANGGTIITSTVALTQFSWNHLAVTRRSGTVTVWVNGASGGTASNSLNMTNQQITIGAEPNTASRLLGSISNVRIIKGTAIYRTPFTPPTSPLVAITGTELLLNTYSGSNFLVDSSVNNFTVTNVNTTVSSGANPFDTDYTLVSGTKAPVLGAGGQSPFPASGWTSIISGSGDDANTQVTLPFTWTYNATGYTSFFPNSNFYITFGAGSNVFSPLNAGSPAVNKIFFAGADNSWQRVSSITSGTNYKRLRWEGTSATSGTPGSPNMVYELTFFNPNLTGGIPWAEILIGQQARGTSGTISGLYSSSSLLTGGGIETNTGIAANQSYVFIGNPLGTSWTVNTGFSVGNTGY